MKKLLFFLIALTIGGHAWAQSQASDPIEQIRSSSNAFWEKKVDTTTDWGKWLMTTRPYWDKIIEVETKNASSLMQIGSGTAPSSDDTLKQFSAVMADFYKEMQGITPPEELKVFHSIVLEQTGKMAKIDTGEQARQAAAEQEALGNQAQKELEGAFKRHGVPQEIIDGFLKD